MPAYLLDSGILIRHLRNRLGYHVLVKRLNSAGDLYISAFTRVEVLRGMREHERERTFALLDGFTTHAIDRATADRAGELLRVSVDHRFDRRWSDIGFDDEITPVDGSMARLRKLAKRCSLNRSASRWRCRCWIT